MAPILYPLHPPAPPLSISTCWCYFLFPTHARSGPLLCVSKSPALPEWTSSPAFMGTPQDKSQITTALPVFEVKWSEVAQSCRTLCDPMDCSPPGSSLQGIFQARILEWVAISFSRGASWSRDWTRVSGIVGRRFTIWATRCAPGYI